jgi:hypothetical protein
MTSQAGSVNQAHGTGCSHDGTRVRAAGASRRHSENKLLHLLTSVAGSNHCERRILGTVLLRYSSAAAPLAPLHRRCRLGRQLVPALWAGVVASVQERLIGSEPACGRGVELGAVFSQGRVGPAPSVSSSYADVASNSTSLEAHYLWPLMATSDSEAPLAESRGQPRFGSARCFSSLVRSPVPVVPRTKTNAMSKHGMSCCESTC